jgi:hypothetical protein
MERYTSLLRNDGTQDRLKAMLETAASQPELHARLVNTLARMEYVGVRKMLKARSSENLDVDGLLHVVEEATHALRLKKAALKLLGSPSGLETFSEDHTLAGAAGEGYLQAVDAACEECLVNLPEHGRTEINYLLSSAMIEIRADVFYPVYEACLQAAGAPFSVRSIQKDEEKHLAEMKVRLESLCPDWRERVEAVLPHEKMAFEAWLTAVESCFPAEPVSA